MVPFSVDTNDETFFNGLHYSALALRIPEFVSIKKYINLSSRRGRTVIN